MIRGDLKTYTSMEELVANEPILLSGTSRGATSFSFQESLSSSFTGSSSSSGSRRKFGGRHQQIVDSRSEDSEDRNDGESNTEKPDRNQGHESDHSSYDDDDDDDSMSLSDASSSSDYPSPPIYTSDAENQKAWKSDHQHDEVLRDPNKGPFSRAIIRMSAPSLSSENGQYSFSSYDRSSDPSEDRPPHTSSESPNQSPNTHQHRHHHHHHHHHHHNSQHHRDRERRLRQGRLLLVSLLENFCMLYDQSPERNRRLFFVLCKQLSAMGIIDSDDFLDEVSAVRVSYKRAFRDLVIQAMQAIREEQYSIRGLPAPHGVEVGGSGNNSVSFSGGGDDPSSSGYVGGTYSSESSEASQSGGGDVQRAS
jgi:hypothetical protein